MIGASAQHGDLGAAGICARNRKRHVTLKQFTRIRAAMRRLDGVDVNWVACYHESAAPGCQQSRASTRFP